MREKPRSSKDNSAGWASAPSSSETKVKQPNFETEKDHRPVPGERRGGPRFASVMIGILLLCLGVYAAKDSVSIIHLSYFYHFFLKYPVIVLLSAIHAFFPFLNLGPSRSHYQGGRDRSLSSYATAIDRSSRIMDHGDHSYFSRGSIRDTRNHFNMVREGQHTSPDAKIYQ